MKPALDRSRLTFLLRAVCVSATAFAYSGCSSDGGADPSGPDAGAPDGTPPAADAGPPDAGTGFCRQDQGGPENRGCDPGFVCNLAMDPPACVPGRACDPTQGDLDCNACSDLQNPEDCGHGFQLTAWCDGEHGSVCVRSRAPCEPCETDLDCGRRDPALGGGANRCIDFGTGDGKNFCTRDATLGCPAGFTENQDNLCVRLEGCSDDPAVCPGAGAISNPDCPGTSQICRGEACPNAGGTRCVTNDQPGSLGLCLESCQTNAECPPDRPVCNTTNGICILGCEAGSCSLGEVCHTDGFCNPPCGTDGDCTADTRYGPDTYCNLPDTSRAAPRQFKNYRDAMSCAPLGCEERVDCPNPNSVCDANGTPPACIDGCFDSRLDCSAGFLCQDAPAGNYSIVECRALSTLPDGNTTRIGTCCDPGCLDRTLDCDIGAFCCGEAGSPFEDPASCSATPGQCSDHDATFCTPCDQAARTDSQCRSDWTPGFNVDPAVNGGAPFAEQEFCVGTALGLTCGVTCRPDGDDTGCPGRYPCRPLYYGCLEDADCGPLECVGADPAADPPEQGFCKCGEDGTQTAGCPSETYLVGPASGGIVAGLPVRVPPPEPRELHAVTNPRCAAGGPVNPGGPSNMVCVASHVCVPDFTEPEQFPAVCAP